MADKLVHQRETQNRTTNDRPIQQSWSKRRLQPRGRRNGLHDGRPADDAQERRPRLPLRVSLPSPILWAPPVVRVIGPLHNTSLLQQVTVISSVDRKPQFFCQLLRCGFELKNVTSKKWDCGKHIIPTPN
ncbi:hypothetical protein GE061_000417 [Apolygus lucorum]|uniref:Uncharacterized protein n=1 Tax=Apolygus lucorum TaxID=248454 RepID=A0A8S9Y5S5_APOLU|nr:hypothetical protein GE061_000417 [Apolygus lucorum]